MPLSPTFNALLREAQFTKDILGSGATQIRRANYASKGLYFQAFTSLSTGLERIGKLCLMTDHYIDTAGTFPDFQYMRKTIGHKIGLLYERTQAVLQKRAIRLVHLQALVDPVHQAILRVLNDYAEGDRYSNINLVVGSGGRDPVAAWFNEVDIPLFENRITSRRKLIIARNAAVVSTLIGPHATTLHVSETGTEIRELEEASRRTGLYEAVAPYRQLYVLQVIRYFSEVLSALEGPAHQVGKEDIPFFGEIFGAFFNHDSYLRTRKTWENL